ncbi:hypothetical protein [Methylobacterium nonmethylotrophicum]|uniref:Uncharacterized protein n=1 Tax=Methylobacterium nonmethylotrophicum TaxID=1141884 RepID=A0A4Z0NYA4_9HYPH|nr:hypothetical protein [Methylobacterium nonmethylotrophicum]TGE02645.1 hypothetical protein EU555_02470 [Methylobacterium nonmethylotrophicum]
MGYKHYIPQNRAKAAALLRQLKGQLVDVTGVQVEARSNVFAAAEAYWQLSKASGVHLYQVGAGWHADLEFKGLPPGVPTIVGTPEPVATRAEAIESVVGMMSICAQRDNVPPPDPATGLRWFRFDDHEVPVDPRMLEHFASRVPVVKFDASHVRRELDLLRADISGDAPVTADAWAAADFQLRYDACRMCCAAMAFGIMQVSYDPSASLELADGPAAPGMH